MTYRQVLISIAGLIAGIGFPAWIWAQETPTDSHIEVSPVPVPLNSEDAALMRVGPLLYRGGLELSSTDPHFGGFSGLIVSPDGARLLAVTDRGHWFTADILQEKGKIEGLVNTYLSPIRDWRGLELVDGENDAEALELLPGGSGVLVAFEGWSRLWRYPSEIMQSYQPVFSIMAQPMQTPKALEDLPRNGGIEAMTYLDENRLMLLAERGEDENGTHKGWLWDQKEAQAFGYQVEQGFHPSDMAMLPGGDLLVLLRSFSPLSGLAVKLEKLSISGVGEGVVLEGQEIARFRPPINIDNMEALAVRRDENGRTMLYLLSDNNFNALQRTLLMVFEMSEE